MPLHIIPMSLRALLSHGMRELSRFLGGTPGVLASIRVDGINDLVHWVINDASTVTYACECCYGECDNYCRDNTFHLDLLVYIIKILHAELLLFTKNSHLFKHRNLRDIKIASISFIYYLHVFGKYLI
ncbi:MAG: hypothetical protein C4575_06665 [Desulforudis sp.]|nr:MAG: hypothetical protein C4575_06665 [Desulforudis sp.]